jgi:ribosomal protein L7/L12
VMQALREGKKIEAIKLFKDETGLGLKESKDIIEAMQNKLGI